MKKQKGYTLIELLIIITIMAVLAGASLVSINIINQAKYNSSISSFKNKLSGLWIVTKATSQAKEQTGSAATTFDKLYPVCMRLQKNSDGKYWLVLGYHANDGFIAKNTDEQDAKNNHDMLEMPKILTIEYEPETPDQVPSKITDSTKGTAFGSPSTAVAMIEFNKSDGSVRYGAGNYKFKFKGRVVGEVKLDAATGKQSSN